MWRLGSRQVTQWHVSQALPGDPSPPVPHAWPALCTMGCEPPRQHAAFGLTLIRVAGEWVPACIDQVITAADHGYPTATPWRSEQDAPS